MIIGIGIDIIELRRIKASMEKQERFIDRILTDNERLVFNRLSHSRKVEYLAGRFAAKEAFVKAKGTGISGVNGWHDVEILNDRSGKPSLYCEGKEHVHVSISHSEEYAVAQVIIESSSC